MLGGLGQRGRPHIPPGLPFRVPGYDVEDGVMASTAAASKTTLKERKPTPRPRLVTPIVEGGVADAPLERQLSRAPSKCADERQLLIVREGHCFQGETDGARLGRAFSFVRAAKRPSRKRQRGNDISLRPGEHVRGNGRTARVRI